MMSFTAQGAIVATYDCAYIAQESQESYIDVGGTRLGEMHA